MTSGIPCLYSSLLQVDLTLSFVCVFKGNAQQDPDAVAKAIMDAIEEFIQKTSVQAVKKVKVVIFQPHILSVFYDNMKDREGSPAPPQPSLLSKISCELFAFIKYIFLTLMLRGMKEKLIVIFLFSLFWLFKAHSPQTEHPVFGKENRADSFPGVWHR